MVWPTLGSRTAKEQEQVPLPLTGSCFSKIQIGFAFLVPAHPTRVVPDKWPLNVRVCLWVSGSRRQPWWFSEARVRGGGVNALHPNTDL